MGKTSSIHSIELTLLEQYWNVTASDLSILPNVQISNGSSPLQVNISGLMNDQGNLEGTTGAAAW